MVIKTDSMNKLAKMIKKKPNKQFTVREVAKELNVSRYIANTLLTAFKIAYQSVGKDLDFRNGELKKYSNKKKPIQPTQKTKKTNKKNKTATSPAATILA
jgi:orotate phosphoribosyltransferase-like protein